MVGAPHMARGGIHGDHTVVDHSLHERVFAGRG
jgi:hypothetical protein